jgi:hypothetical protein
MPMLMPMRGAHLAPMVFFISWPAVTAIAQTPRPGIHAFLAEQADVSGAELQALDGGQILVKTLDTKIGSEAALIGVVRLRATTSFFLRMFEDIERFETGWGVTKKISDSPRIEDFATLEIPDGDFEDLRSCKPGACDVKLGEPALEHLQKEVDWGAPDARAKVVEFVRQRALEYATAYRKGGNKTLAVYRDSNKPTLVSEELEGLLASSPYIMEYRPELQRYLLDYPEAQLPGARDFLYWSIVDVGPKPTMRMSHVTIYSLADGPNESAIIASKQLYFSHYFHTGLELTTLIQDPEHPDDGFYLMNLDRYRTDVPGGMFGKMAKNVAVKSARDSLERYLTVSKKAIETYFQNEKSPGRD